MQSEKKILGAAPLADLLPAGEYPAELTSIREFANRFEDRLAFGFTVESGAHAGAMVEIATAARLALLSKLAKVVGAIRGVPVTAEEYSEGFVSNDLVGTRCRIIVEHDSDRAGTSYAKIGHIISEAPLNGRERQTGEMHAASTVSN